MQKTMTLGLCAVLLGAGINGAALADPGRGEGRAGIWGGLDFAAVDADGDGKITEAEVQAYRAARTAELDADGDGKINEAELVAQGMRDAETRATARAKRMIERLDSDGDGSLSAAELMTRGRNVASLLDRIDADDDGAVTEAEIDAARERFQDRRGDRRMRYHDRPSHRWGADRG
ncbi:MAG: EF-hand domain-containing protein [Pseudorhodobacter sp.]